jgi:transposase
MAGKNAIEHFGLYLKECQWRFNTPYPKEQLIQLKSWVRDIL